MALPAAVVDAGAVRFRPMMLTAMAVEPPHAESARGERHH
jgi:hypothetical protein